MAKSISLQEIHLSNIGVRSEFGAKLGQAMAMNPLCRLVHKKFKIVLKNSEKTRKINCATLIYGKRIVKIQFLGAVEFPFIY